MPSGADRAARRYEAHCETFYTRFLLLLAIAVVVIAGFFQLFSTGLSARGTPGALETRLARTLQRLAIPHSARELRHPLQAAPGLLVAARRHFANHCAS